VSVDHSHVAEFEKTAPPYRHVRRELAQKVRDHEEEYHWLPFQHPSRRNQGSGNEQRGEWRPQPPLDAAVKMSLARTPVP